MDQLGNDVVVGFLVTATPPGAAESADLGAQSSSNTTAALLPISLAEHEVPMFSDGQLGTHLRLTNVPGTEPRWQASLISIRE